MFISRIFSDATPTRSPSSQRQYDTDMRNSRGDIVKEGQLTPVRALLPSKYRAHLIHAQAHTITYWSRHTQHQATMLCCCAISGCVEAGGNLRRTCIYSLNSLTGAMSVCNCTMHTCSLFDLRWELTLNHAIGQAPTVSNMWLNNTIPNCLWIHQPFTSP